VFMQIGVKTPAIPEACACSYFGRGQMYFPGVHKQVKWYFEIEHYPIRGKASFEVTA
jgi:hypothetical protein